MANPDTMIFTNPTDHTIKLDAIGLNPVGPGKDVVIPFEYVAPGRSASGNRAPSIIESVAPQLKPKDPKDKELWAATPGEVTPVSRIVTVSAKPVLEAPGVKALRELAEAQIKAQTAAAVAQAKVSSDKAAK